MSRPIRSSDEVLRDMQGAGRIMARLLAEYRWGEQYAFAPGGSSDFEARVASGPSNTTQDAAMDPRRIEVRRAMRRTDRRVNAAIRKLREAEEDLEASFGEFRSGADPLPPNVTRAEVDQAKAAKTRRERRGEGWGDA